MKNKLLQNTLVTKAPVTISEMLRLLQRYYKLYGIYPDLVLLAQDGEKPIVKSALAYLMNTQDGD